MLKWIVGIYWVGGKVFIVSCGLGNVMKLLCLFNDLEIIWMIFRVKGDV